MRHDAKALSNFLAPHQLAVGMADGPAIMAATVQRSIELKKLVAVADVSDAFCSTRRRNAVRQARRAGADFFAVAARIYSGPVTYHIWVQGKSAWQLKSYFTFKGVLHSYAQLFRLWMRLVVRKRHLEPSITPLLSVPAQDE